MGLRKSDPIEELCDRIQYRAALGEGMAQPGDRADAAGNPRQGRGHGAALERFAAQGFDVFAIDEKAFVCIEFQFSNSEMRAICVRNLSSLHHDSQRSIAVGSLAGRQEACKSWHSLDQRPQLAISSTLE